MNNYHNDKVLHVRMPEEMKKRVQAAADLELLNLTTYVKRVLAADAKRLGL
jgi:hypothetical protein